MKKTEIQIERDFYQFVKKSALGAAIRGTVYRSEMRPADAKEEDLIVKFLSGTDEQIQRGTVIFNLYVPDIIYTDGRKVADKQRIGELEELMKRFSEEFDDADYCLTSSSTPYSTLNPDIEQHLIVQRINFQRIS